jgi:hypothetical protein
MESTFVTVKLKTLIFNLILFSMGNSEFDDLIDVLAKAAKSIFEIFNRK